MRELTIEEVAQVSGGLDGFKLPGSNYISSTRAITGASGIFGAMSGAFSAGYAIGSAINSGIESAFGMNAGDVIYDWTHSS